MSARALTMPDALAVLTSRAGSTYALGCIKALEGDRFLTVAQDKPALARLHLQAGGSPGDLVVQCLRAYAERDLSSVYEWAQELAPALYPSVSEAKAARARRRAADLYADCYLALAEFVSAWNQQADQGGGAMKKDCMLRDVRVTNDRLTLERAQLVARIGKLEQENEALRDMVAFVAKSAGGGAVL